MSLPIAAGPWTVDPTHSQISFVAKHLGFTKVRGKFNEFEAKVVVGETLETSSLHANVNLLSVDTGQADRDAHLKNADFFGASEKPEMTFASTSIVGTPDSFEINGDLTINGKTLPVTFKAEFGGTDVDPFGNTKAGFEATTEINRTDFGIDWNMPVGGGLLVSEKVKVELDIQLVPAS